LIVGLAKFHKTPGVC